MMRILFVASEGLPFSKTGGLADVVEALPKALVMQGHEVGVVLPRYRGGKAGTPIVPSLTIPLGNRLRFPAIADGTLLDGVRYFFVDDPAYFDRDGLYGTAAGDYPDNPERYSEFCRAAIELSKHAWPTDVFHCHDWQTGLLPVLLRTSYGDDSVVKDLPVVFTVHNMGYPGMFRRDALARAGVPETLALVLRDYSDDQGIEHLRTLSPDALMDLPKVVSALNLDEHSKELHVELAPKGYRILHRLPQLSDTLIERLVARFGSLPEILSASAAELESIEGIGAATARHVRDGLARLVEASIFERYE